MKKPVVICRHCMCHVRWSVTCGGYVVAAFRRSGGDAECQNNATTTCL
ncbi:unnamed protein product [Linum tenue]|uniref:Uncharacterized protein n=1 Tax=Linum tenue TaxID=586396 RepID=A0AAV0HND5_9ROSI|nr:unnamed protein product [Linum tenue]